MIDVEFVGALVRGDISQYYLDTADIQELTRQRLLNDTSRAVKSSHNSTITGEAAALLAEAQVRSTVKSVLQALAANDVAKILGQAGIPALVYKGVAFAAIVTGDWRGRESTDVDVLIAPGSVAAAHKALQSAGLKRQGHNQQPPSRFHRFRAIEETYTGLPATIDLHWHVDSPGYFAIPFDEMWSRRRRLSGDGLEVWTPATAESLLIAAVHGTRESWRSLRHVMDFGLLATELSPEDWQEAEQFSRLGARKSLAIALAVAQQCGVDPLPATPGQWAQDVAKRLVESLQQSLDPDARRSQIPHISPRAALHRRLARWREAPNKTTAFSGLVRSAMRQVGEGGKRTWDPRGENNQTK